MTQPAPVASARQQRTDIALLRVIAIVGVVLIHVTGLTVVNKDVRGTQVWWLAEVVNATSRFCVPMFVLVSGALLLRPGSTEPAGAFLRRRLERLLPALVFWYLAYSVFVEVVLGTHRGLTGALAVALAGRTYTALYFFWLILGLYLATPALRKLLAGLSSSSLLQAGMGLTALTCTWQTTVLFIGRYSSVDVSARPSALTYWLPYVGYFVLGAGLAQLRPPRRVAPYAGALLVVCSALTAWTASGHAPGTLGLVASSSYHSWSVAGATIGLYLLVTSLVPPRTAAPRATERVVERLGGLTLGVFATHLLVLYALQHAGLMTVEKGASRLLELGYLSVATVLLSFAVTWAGSRVPVVERVL